AGTLWREGKLVRMDRGGALPDRCVVCNEQSSGKRVARTLYWSPALWRNLSAATPFLLAIAGIAFSLPLLVLLFWPAVIVIAIAHTIVRKKLKLELAACQRHHRQRNVLGGLSLAAMAGMVAVFLNWAPTMATVVGLLAAVGVLVALAVVQSYVGVHAVKLKKLDSQHAWLSGTGKTFREALPELPNG
ncbi:MAG TPA: hypothetical protein VM183_14940, partial [Burkholderiales bacterium]|nr:hypothetical protein [Burkholderiales bacterium]